MTTADTSQVFDLRFDHFDANKDGTIDRSDFESEADQVIEAFGADPLSPRARALKDSYIGVYEYLISKAGSTNGTLTREQFVTISQSSISDQGDPGFADVLRPYAQASANLCDTDGDGQITRDEYDKWLTVIGVSPDDADASYQKIDTNKDGIVSIDEFVEAIRSYVLGERDLRMLG